MIALFVSVFDCFFNALNVCFKFWVDQPTKKRFYIYFKYFENKNYF